MKVKSESEVTQSCLTPSDPMDCSLPGPPPMGFSRQEYRSGVPSSSPYNALEHSYIAVVKPSFVMGMTACFMEG